MGDLKYSVSSYPTLIFSVYKHIDLSRRRFVRKLEMAKWYTSMDRVDHMAVGDCKRVWALQVGRPLDYAEQIALDDATEATSLPYAVSVSDE